MILENRTQLIRNICRLWILPLTFKITFLLPPFSGSEAIEPRHHPEHSAGSGCGPRHPWAMLCLWEDVFPQHPLLWRGQERGAEGLPQHDCRFLRLQIVSFPPRPHCTPHVTKRRSKNKIQPRRHSCSHTLTHTQTPSEHNFPFALEESSCCCSRWSWDCRWEEMDHASYPSKICILMYLSLLLNYQLGSSRRTRSQTHYRGTQTAAETQKRQKLKDNLSF